MKITSDQINDLNNKHASRLNEEYDQLANRLVSRNIDLNDLDDKLSTFQIAIPSWALGTGGTRFGRFSGGGEPGSLEEKINDIGLLHKLNNSSGFISLHIPWDIPENYDHINQLAADLHLKFDSVNSNTFQDQPDSIHSYKFGSLDHHDNDTRQLAVDHNKEVIDHGERLGAKSLTVWLADGASFPGQKNFRKAFQNLSLSLQEIYNHLPEDWKLLIEYKPYEPNFYSMTIPDWGTSHLLAQQLGKKAYSLVDLGHHLPNTNIEQIVAILMHQNKLGGFHFNDSKYGDDDLTVGSLKPYQLFLIFNELVEGITNTDNITPAWMIDASHNLKDPLEDLIQSVEAILIAYCRALIIDQNALAYAQQNNDVAGCQEILQDAFMTDVRPLIAKNRLNNHASVNPLEAYRNLNVRETLIKERGSKQISSGL
ncbi:TIM barrel protein [Marinigracilibium pacificum]|uniref:Sugar isomerase n=1 Tax=Marinigracilibium pacificum TaxID=2729599 RepID=A0A848IVI3_9BACT|nr:TIM barrel protein [Marinigracilibium pacificum]NMM48347.1 sugar isomerase [Marinigracilibium pacificum]